MKFIFIIPSVNDSHARNRIVEFIEKGYEVNVYGFERTNNKKSNPSPYKIVSLGTLSDKRYTNRIKLYYKEFKRLGRIYNPNEVVFYLFGLDIALFFHMANPGFRYVYEECDLTHTYTRFKKPLELIDRIIIKQSILTITTSEGFIKYHFKDKVPSNVCVVKNKLNSAILDYAVKQKRVFDKSNISIGFVGAPRFKSIYCFIDVFCRNYPQYIFHVFGGPIPPEFEPLRNYANCVFHGFFKNPDELSEIYSSIDLVLSTYDVEFDNVKYAEPNKLYESIYFETPIIVSSGTFLAEKVRGLGVGYDIDPLNEQSIIDFVQNLSKEKLAVCQSNAQKISKRNLVSINDHLFEKLRLAIDSIS